MAIMTKDGTTRAEEICLFTIQDMREMGYDVYEIDALSWLSCILDDMLSGEIKDPFTTSVYFAEWLAIHAKASPKDQEMLSSIYVHTFWVKFCEAKERWGHMDVAFDGDGGAVVDNDQAKRYINRLDKRVAGYINDDGELVDGNGKRF